ncbi:hypothetical protein BOX15_Mlig010811g3, partial [Macrostomum lignano]
HTNYMDQVQQDVQLDWNQREYIDLIGFTLKRMTDFLNQFDVSCRSKIAQLNEKLTLLERKVDFIEARIKRDELVAAGKQAAPGDPAN